MFELVEAFVSSAAPGSSGRLFLLNGKPGGELFCLESDSAVRLNSLRVDMVLSKLMLAAVAATSQKRLKGLKKQSEHRRRV